MKTSPIPWQARHRLDLPGDGHNEPGAGHQPQLSHGEPEPVRHASNVRIPRQRERGLGDADRKLECVELGGLVASERRQVHAIGAVERRRQCGELRLECVTQPVGVPGRGCRAERVHEVRQRKRTLTATRHGIARYCANAAPCSVLQHQRDLVVRVVRKTVDANDHRQPEAADTCSMMVQLGQPGLELAAAVRFEARDRGDQHDATGPDPCHSTLEVQELLASKVEAEAGLGHHVLREAERHARGDHAVAALRDVGERAAVDQGRPAFRRAHQVREQRVLQQRRHGPGGAEVGGRYGNTSARLPDSKPAQAQRQVRRIAREAKHGHHLARCSDVEPRLPNRAAEPDDDVSERTIVHVRHARPSDRAGVEVLAMVQRVVCHRSEQPVRRAYGVDVAREV